MTDVNSKTVALVIVAILVVAGVAGAIVVSNNGEAQYTITYDANYDGAPEAKKFTYIDGVELSKPSTMVLRENHVYSGWYFDKECTKEVEFPYKVTGDVTFYAKWTVFEAGEFFDTQFFNTPFGQYLNESKKITTDYEGLFLDVSSIKQIRSNGIKHVLIELADGYNVYDKDAKLLFTIPKVLEDKPVETLYITNLTVCTTEFVTVYTADGYYVYDMSGVKYGPAQDVPKVVLNSKVILGDSCYKFDNDGKFVKEFDFGVGEKHIPVAGSGNSYYEIEKTHNTEDELIETTVNFLDNKFDVKYTFEFPANSHRDVCFYLGGESYLVQYALPSTSDDYTYSENGVKYTLHTLIYNGTTGQYSEKEDFKYPAFAASNMMNPFSFIKMYNENLKNVISLYKTNSHKELDTTGKILVSFNSNGEVVKTFSVSKGYYNLAFMFPVEDTNKVTKFFVYFSDVNDGERSATVALLDIKLNFILADVMANNCKKYLIRTVSDDSNIYDLSGEVIGNYNGMTYVASTNNLLFFTDKDGRLFSFNGNEMREHTDYIGDLVVRNSFYGYKVGINQYRFFTESGKIITDSKSVHINEVTLVGGTHLASIYIGDGNYKIFKLKTE